MTPFHNRLTPLTQRMAEDMQVRNLSPSTIDAYTYHVDKFLALLRPTGRTTRPGRDPPVPAVPGPREESRLEQLQPGRLWPTVSVRLHAPADVDT